MAERDVYRQKAYDARKHHLERSQNCQGLTLEQLEHEYGWEINLIAHDFRVAAQNGCRNCGNPFRNMRYGLHDLTLDMTDPERLPWYRTNTGILCGRCNRRKRRKHPDDWEREEAARKAQQLGMW